MADGAARASRTAEQLTLRVPAEAAMLRQLRAALRAWLRRLRWPDDEAAAILHAVEEAFTNVIEHAYAFDDAGEVVLTARGLISCAVPRPTTSSHSRSKRVPTVDRDRVALALDAAAAQCRRARVLIGSAQAGRLRRRAQSAARRLRAALPVTMVWRDRVA